MKIQDGIRAVSVTGFDRRYDGYAFKSDVKCVELYDWEGDVPGPFESVGPRALGVRYSLATSFYATFRGSSFEGPVIFDIGEYAAEKFKPNGDAVTDVRVNMANCFRNSGVQIFPHGGSRELISNTNYCFAGCRSLRSWTPQEMVAAGLAGVQDPNAPRLLRTNGIAGSAFLRNLAPETMRGMFAECESYDGNAINAISWKNLNNERSAEDFAAGCRFAPHFLDGLIASIYAQREGIHRPLLRVDLGAGRVTGETARMARELIDSDIRLMGFEID